MLVKDFLKVLSQCDPNGTVTLSIPAAWVDKVDSEIGIEYGFEPHIQTLYSSSSEIDVPQPDRIYITVCECDMPGQGDK